MKLIAALTPFVSVTGCKDAYAGNSNWYSYEPHPSSSQNSHLWAVRIRRCCRMNDLSLKLRAYLDGELVPAETQAIEQQLKTDPAAQSELDAQAAALDQFEAQLDQPAPLSLIRHQTDQASRRNCTRSAHLGNSRSKSDSPNDRWSRRLFLEGPHGTTAILWLACRNCGLPRPICKSGPNLRSLIWPDLD